MVVTFKDTIFMFKMFFPCSLVAHARCDDDDDVMMMLFYMYNFIST